MNTIVYTTKYFLEPIDLLPEDEKYKPMIEKAVAVFSKKIEERLMKALFDTGTVVISTWPNIEFYSRAGLFNVNCTS